MKKYILIIILLLISRAAHSVELDAYLSWAGQYRNGFVANGIVDDVISVGSKVEKTQSLASLDRQPFIYKLKQYQAAVNKFEPLVLDAKLELDHAKELFERTVLSEVELQKIEGNYNSLAAEQAAEKAKLQMAKWKLNRAVLKSKEEAYVIYSNILPGMVISDENKSDVYIQLASTSRASAIALLSMEQKRQLKLEGTAEVEIDGDKIPARIHSIAMQPDKDNQYQVIAVFNYAKMIEPGKKLKLNF